MKIDNHYVPKLILRRYNEQINTYNLKTRKLTIGANLRDSFSSKFLYSQEIEDLFNSKLEVEFAKILDRKILIDSDEIILTRKELATTKKFLLLAMLRTVRGEEFMRFRREKISDHLRLSLNFEEKTIDGESDFDYWMRTMRCILESPDLVNIKEHPLATIKAVQWATNFNVAYLSVWDSSNSGEDFIVIDNGMTSEHEPSRFLDPINDDALKRGYLLDKTLFAKNLPKDQIENRFKNYYSILFANDFMTENFYLFSITKERMLVLINPFFRLYDKSSFDEPNILPLPDIWPTKVVDRNLFLKNRNHYLNGFQEALNGNASEMDLYIYPVRKMSVEDVIYINVLGLDRIEEIMGFSDSSRIRRSLAVYSIVTGLNDYSDLIRQLIELGSQIKVDGSVIRIKQHISTLKVSFNSRELYYINNFLKMREFSKGYPLS